jgi:hypothetical protein
VFLQREYSDFKILRSSIATSAAEMAIVVMMVGTDLHARF